jgi:hypothetical protein
MSQSLGHRRTRVQGLTLELPGFWLTLGQMLLGWQKAEITDEYNEVTSKRSEGKRRIVCPHENQGNYRNAQLTRQTQDNLGHQGIKMLNITNSANDFTTAVAFKITNGQTQQTLAIMHHHLQL